MKTTTLETTSAIAGKASMAAGGTTVAISFLSQEFIFAGIGVLVTLATFAVNLYYKRRADARAQAHARHEAEEHALRMVLLQQGHAVLPPMPPAMTETGDAP